MKRAAWGNGYSGISVVLVVEEVALVEIVMPTVVLVVMVEEVVPFVEVLVVVVVVSVVVSLLMLLKSSLMFVPVSDTVFVIEPKLEPEVVTVIVPEVPIGNA